MRRAQFVSILLSASMLIGVAPAASASVITSVSFSPPAGSFSFRWDDPTKCNPADPLSCFVTSVDITDGFGVRWTNPSDVAGFSATFVNNQLSTWRILFLRTVTNLGPNDGTYGVIYRETFNTGAANTGYFASSQPSFGCIEVGTGAPTEPINCRNLLIGVPGSGGSPGNSPGFTWTSTSARTSVPEPGSLALLGLGLAGLGALRRKRS